ncbi:MAG: methyltransferase domain-containing protein [Candidatus Saccharimonadales bacterium]
MKKVSKIDDENLKAIRENVSRFIKGCAKKYDKSGELVLDIAPQVHEGAKSYFKKSTVQTLDIDEDAGATYTADLCENNSHLISDNHFDYVVCTEVLEHTLQPFDAAAEIERILKPGGLALISVPFNFRIHGPLPDCWRFTEHGLRALFKDFEIIQLTPLESQNRFLMPIHYTLIVKKDFQLRDYSK